VHGCHRHIQLVATGILQRQKLGLESADRQCLQAQVTADTVIFVHHGCVDSEVGEVAYDSIGIALRSPSALLQGALTEQQRFGNNRQRPLDVEPGAEFQRRHSDGQRVFAFVKCRPVVHRPGFQAEFTQLAEQRFATSRGLGTNQAAAVKV
jgi:hypothetical protein